MISESECTALEWVTNMGPFKRSSEGTVNCELSDILAVLFWLLMGRLGKMNTDVTK